MSNITGSYAKDLDLNLLRVFLVVAEEGSITRAAARLYVTQPAVSGSMRRLGEVVGAPLFTRQGRGLVLTHRGSSLLAVARMHLGPLVQAVLVEPRFDAKTSTALVRFGVDDGIDSVVLPPLIERLRETAPRMKLVVMFVSCHDVEEMLLGAKVDFALCPADEPPRSIHREPLVDASRGMDFVCLYDSRFVKFPKKATAKQYFSQKHVAVSYSGDGRGVVEDVIGRDRDIRVCLPGFSSVGDIVDGSPLVATVPASLAAHFRRTRPHLRTALLPFSLEGARLDLLWSRVADSDEAVQFVCAELRAVVSGLDFKTKRRAAASRGAR